MVFIICYFLMVFTACGGAIDDCPLPLQHDHCYFSETNPVLLIQGFLDLNIRIPYFDHLNAWVHALHARYDACNYCELLSGINTTAIGADNTTLNELWTDLDCNVTKELFSEVANDTQRHNNDEKNWFYQFVKSNELREQINLKMKTQPSFMAARSKRDLARKKRFWGLAVGGTALGVATAAKVQVNELEEKSRRNDALHSKAIESLKSGLMVIDDQIVHVVEMTNQRFTSLEGQVNQWAEVVNQNAAKITEWASIVTQVFTTFQRSFQTSNAENRARWAVQACYDATERWRLQDSELRRVVHLNALMMSDLENYIFPYWAYSKDDIIREVCNASVHAPEDSETVINWQKISTEDCWAMFKAGVENSLSYSYLDYSAMNDSSWIALNIQMPLGTLHPSCRLTTILPVMMPGTDVMSQALMRADVPIIFEDRSKMWTIRSLAKCHATNEVITCPSGSPWFLGESTDLESVIASLLEGSFSVPLPIPHQTCDAEWVTHNALMIWGTCDVLIIFGKKTNQSLTVRPRMGGTVVKCPSFCRIVIDTTVYIHYSANVNLTARAKIKVFSMIPWIVQADSDWQEEIGNIPELGELRTVEIITTDNITRDSTLTAELQLYLNRTSSYLGEIDLERTTRLLDHVTGKIDSFGSGFFGLVYNRFGSWFWLVEMVTHWVVTVGLAAMAIGPKIYYWWTRTTPYGFAYSQISSKDH